MATVKFWLSDAKFVVSTHRNCCNAFKNDKTKRKIQYVGEMVGTEGWNNRKNINFSQVLF